MDIYQAAAQNLAEPAALPFCSSINHKMNSRRRSACAKAHATFLASASMRLGIFPIFESLIDAYGRDT